MSLFIIIAIASILIAGGFLCAFVWSVRDGQYDDTFAPPNRILFDETTTNNTNH